MPTTLHPRPKVVVSGCLLGQNVRYDSGHCRERFLTDDLGKYVDWVPVCPEMEAGFGRPRPAMHLVAGPGGPADDRLVTRAGKDVTAPLHAATDRVLARLSAVDGFVLKRSSPSCAPERLKVYRIDEAGHRQPAHQSAGLFARRVLALYGGERPSVPIEDEGRLNDPVLRMHFATRIFAAARWRQLVEAHPDERGLRHALGKFHAAHKLLLLVHDEVRCRELGRLVADAADFERDALLARYGRDFAKALSKRPTANHHRNALEHLAGHLRGPAPPEDRARVQSSIADHTGGLVPLVVPLVLLSFLLEKYALEWPLSQVYLCPFPRELALETRLFNPNRNVS